MSLCPRLGRTIPRQAGTPSRCNSSSSPLLDAVTQNLRWQVRLNSSQTVSKLLCLYSAKHISSNKLRPIPSNYETQGRFVLRVSQIVDKPNVNQALGERQATLTWQNSAMHACTLCLRLGQRPAINGAMISPIALYATSMSQTPGSWDKRLAAWALCYTEFLWKKQSYIDCAALTSASRLF